MSKRISFWDLKLTWKILIVFATVIGALTIVAVVIAYNGVTDSTRQAGDERITEEVLVIQARIAEAERQLAADTKYVAQNLAFSQAMRTGDVQTIQTRLLLNEPVYPVGVDHILVVDASGRPMVSMIDRKIMSVDDSEPQELLSFALLGISVTGVLEAEDRFVLAAAAPVQTSSGEIVGAVQVGRRLDDNFLRGINFGRADVYLVLLDRGGSVVASTVQEPRDSPPGPQDGLGENPSDTPLSPGDHLTRHGITPDLTAAAMALNGEVNFRSALTDNGDGRPLVAAYMPFSVNYDTQGVLAIFVDMNTLLSFRNDLIKEQIIALVLIGVALAILFVWLAWRMIAAPITRLQQVTVRLADGDYSLRASAHHQDEIGQLACAFNAMAENLLQRDRQIGLEIEERTKAEQALRASHDELEQRVAERTLELQETNDRLRNELELREQAESQIRDALREKEVLLKEVHHRVKNNMQVMSSLLHLQSNYTNDAPTIEVLRESQLRVRSMALVHERLYQSTDMAGISSVDYVHDLLRHLADSYRPNDNNIRLETQIDDLTLDIDTAIPVGLILSELVSNAFKHAFRNGQHGAIRIEMRGEGDTLTSLVVQDDGVGMPETIDPSRAQSLGLQLVASLSKQLGGALELAREHGTVFRIQFEQ